MTSLRDIVAKQVAAEELPLVHTTRCEKLDELRTTHQLNEPICDVFGEPVVYFFYGRPAYRSLFGREPGGGLELCPIALVFKPYTIARNIRRIFTCDSGAIHGGFLEPYVPREELLELELEPNISSAQRLVSLIFGNNKDYFEARAMPSPAASLPGGGTAERWHNLIRNPTLRTSDDRMSAIEIQVHGPIELRGSLLYVVLPGELLNDEQVRRTVYEQWNCDPIPYKVYPGSPPYDYYGVIREAVGKRYEEARRI